MAIVPRAGGPLAEDDPGGVARRAVALTRSNAFFYHPNLLGIVRVEPEGDEAIRLRLEREPCGSQAHGVSLCAIATLVDIALTVAMRVRIAPDALIATASLSLHLLVDQTPGPLTAAAGAHRIVNGEGIATCLIERNGVRVAQATGHFLAQRETLPPQNRSLPSRQDARHAEVPADAALTPVERGEVEDVVAASGRSDSSGRPLSEELLRPEWESRESGIMRARLALTPALSNRFGNMHGAALFAAGALAASHALGSPATFVAGHALFLGPAKGAVEIEPAVLRRGRTLASVEAHLRSEGQQIVAAYYEFRMKGTP